jgi:hypothetical protein
VFESYDAKAWLRISVGYVKGRLTRSSDDWPGRFVAADFLASDGGDAECLCCPEIGYKQFRRRHTLARFIRDHRHCGKAVLHSEHLAEPRSGAKA